jgi:hypothetical protein
LDGAEFAPSPKVWEGVQAGLAPKKKVGLFFMWQTYGVAAAIIFLFTMGFLLRDELFTPGGGPTSTTELASDSDLDDKTDQEDKKTLKENKGTRKNEKGSQQDDVDSSIPKDLQQDTGLQAGNEIDQSSKTIHNNKLQAGNNTGRNSQAKEGGNVSSSDRSGENPGALIKEGAAFSRSVADQLQVNAEVLTDAEFAIYLADPQNYRESIAGIRLRWELKNLVAPMDIDSSLFVKKGLANIVASNTSLNGNLGSGSFNPNGSGIGGGTAAVENLSAEDPEAGQFDVANGEERQLGSLSIGAGIGIELNRRWLLRLGLRYNQYRYANTSNAYFQQNGTAQPLSLNANFDASTVRFVGEYELTNTIHSISVPVQFGYKLLDRSRFDIVLNAGIGIDYFVSYIIQGDLNFLERRSIDLGESDFLNRFNANVLTGFELNYKLNDKFGISGEAFFRQYIPSLSQTDGVSQATPSFLGFGLGVNYFLRKKK